MEHPEFIKKIDWKLLREQKQTLLEIREMSDFISQDYNSFDGLIHLIDALQDFACDEMGLAEKEIFNLNSEEDDSN